MKQKIISVLLTVIMLLSMLPMSTFAENLNTARIIIGTTDAIPGDIVEVAVKLENNPGIVSANIKLSFDEGLTLVDAINGDVFPSSISFIKPKQLENGGKITKGCQFVWNGFDIADADIKDGTMLKLRFELTEKAQIGDMYSIKITADDGDVIDRNLNSVILNDIGKVAAIDYTPGDVNADGKINMLDVVMLSRYIVDGCTNDPTGYGIDLDTRASNVNDDGRINMLDVVLISRYIIDGCKTDLNGYNVTLLHESKKCNHVMQATAAKEATCTDDGNITYWYCSICDRYFADENGSRVITVEDTVVEAKGHAVVIDPAVPATYESTGLTEGSHCEMCETIIVPQIEIPKLESNQHRITYDIANGDTYLATQNIENPNPNYYTSEKGLTLKNPVVPGYIFLGWYDLPAGNNAEIVKKISVGEKEEYTLYAHWEKIQYEVQYKSDIFIEKELDHYTVDKGLSLPTPKLSNYTFVGWTDEDGNLYKDNRISVGTTGTVVLTANWTSERNKTFTKPKLDAPIIVEDEESNSIFFTYEIGEIQNVPIYTVHDFGYIADNGVAKTETKTYKASVTDTEMEKFTKSVSNATTKSSSWTLSSDWNESTYINYEDYKETGLTKEEIDEIAKSETDTWNISSGTSGSSSVTSTSTNSSGWSSDSKISDTSRSEDNEGSHTNDYKNNNFNINAGVGYEAVVGPGKLDASLDVGYERGWGSSTDKEEWHSDVSTHSADFSNNEYSNQSSSSSASSSSSWNSSKSKGGSVTNSSSRTVANAITEKVAETYGYGETIDVHEGNEETTGIAATENVSDEYASSVVYSKEVSNEVTSTWTTKDTKSGYHRWILTGKVHVFAVVSYDMSNELYSVYTFGVMDDSSPKEFEDYSNISSNYDDHENGVIPFEIPIEVEKYVLERTCYSDGLKVDQTTGKITGYSGKDKYVIIPEYMNVGNGDVIKITGISENAFRNNSEIELVKLSNFIKEIPANSFENCTSLRGLMGGSITKIGNEAFKNCTSIETCCLDSKIEFLGDNAFMGCNRLLVNAANADIAKSAVQSGAKKIQLYVNSKTTDDTNEMLNNVTLSLPETTELFSFTGYGYKFPEFKIVSDAKETVITKTGFDVSNGTPIKISSPDVVLNQVNVKSNGLGAVFTADQTNLSLQSNVNIDTGMDVSVLCKDLILSEHNEKVDGILDVSRKVYVCGKVDNQALLKNKGDEIIVISEEDYNKYLKGVLTVTFDANGGSVGTSNKTVYYGQPYSELSIPTRANYTFDGWFTAVNGGTKVESDTVVTTTENHVLYAHWKPNKFTLTYNANGGSVSPTTKTLKFGDAYGTLPTPTRSHYTFKGWFTAASGGAQVSASTKPASASNVTIYAHWQINPYKVSWSTGTGYSIIVKRTSSPNAGAATGTLSNGAYIYYGDVLSIAYTAATGYSISSKGSTSITVSGNVTSSNIWATASANSYTYTIKYKSSNGTDLGSSSATYKFGTTNTISAPAKTGYNTPSSQSVKWDSTSKTITFSYSPISRSTTQTVDSGRWWTSDSGNTKLNYKVEAQWRNRTATSIEIKVHWTNTITNSYNQGKYGYKQEFEWWGWHTIASASAFSSAGGTRSSSCDSGWHKYTISPTDTTHTIGSEWKDNNGRSGNWGGTVAIPAY